MSNFLNAISADSRTHNGAITHSSSLNYVLDMFFLAGASRNMSEHDIISVFKNAYSQDRNLALKCLFWARDVRGGAGERRFFRVIWKELSNDIRYSLMDLVPEYGRWDDLFATGGIQYIAEALTGIINVKDYGLLCKWMPRKGDFFEKVRKFLGMSPKELRRIIVDGTCDIVERKMSNNEWSDINYSHIPSQAFHKYKKAFERHDEARFTEFIEVDADNVKSTTLFPYQIFQSYSKGENNSVINAQWNNLPNYLANSNERFIPMPDVSGSMDGLPMDISVSLGVYLAERNVSEFHNAFITFSEKPQLQYLTGNTASEKFSQLRRADWGMSTNLEAAFDLILNRAKSADLSQEDMPTKILIISDMEFNKATDDDTNYESIKSKYSNAGYEMPGIVFWNVNGRLGNVPVTANTENVALVSGASPAIVKSVLGGEDFTPVSVMLKTLESERYNQIYV